MRSHFRVVDLIYMALCAALIARRLYRWLYFYRADLLGCGADVWREAHGTGCSDAHRAGGLLRIRDSVVHVCIRTQNRRDCTGNGTGLVRDPFHCSGSCKNGVGTAPVREIEKTHPLIFSGFGRKSRIRHAENPVSDLFFGHA